MLYISSWLMGWICQDYFLPPWDSIWFSSEMGFIGGVKSKRTFTIIYNWSSCYCGKKQQIDYHLRFCWKNWNVIIFNVFIIQFTCCPYKPKYWIHWFTDNYILVSTHHYHSEKELPESSFRYRYSSIVQTLFLIIAPWKFK